MEITRTMDGGTAAKSLRTCTMEIRRTMDGGTAARSLRTLAMEIMRPAYEYAWDYGWWNHSQHGDQKDLGSWKDNQVTQKPHNGDQAAGQKLSEALNIPQEDGMQADGSAEE
ncbi:hypothetical protein AK812_SmicGene48473 [Symbiodinium microadriaticum]|uniref:Uncharacterized protein n=1 Tax=Symbiodinium microadriaticum TaxID=2951 RepID=A0A1Q9BFG0_SYMMI|nr:hypothetical protein AK812_SmicGene48473 [Symbiodinium microadriaticum]